MTAENTTASGSHAPRRLGILGGSFDPVHLGHVLVAHAAREEMKLDEVMFVPAGRSPFKAAVAPAPDALRLRMLRLALAGLPWCGVSELELLRQGVSYSVDTVGAIAAASPGQKLFFIIGSDNVRGLDAWREAETLGRTVEFIVVPRPGETAVPAPAGFVLHWLRGCPMDVASSEIRRRVREGLPFEHLVPTAVAEVIRNNRLYL